MLIHKFAGLSMVEELANFHFIQPKSNSVCMRECSECSNWCKLKYHNADSQIYRIVDYWRTWQFFTSFKQNQSVYALENVLDIQTCAIFVLINRFADLSMVEELSPFSFHSTNESVSVVQNVLNIQISASSNIFVLIQ